MVENTISNIAKGILLASGFGLQMGCKSVGIDQQSLLENKSKSASNFTSPGYVFKGLSTLPEIRIFDGRSYYKKIDDQKDTIWILKDKYISKSQN